MRRKNCHRNADNSTEVKFAIQTPVDECYLSNLSGVLVGSQSLEVVDLDQLAEGVEALSGLVVLVLSSDHTDSDSVWDVSDALAPNELIQLHINSVVLSNEAIHNGTITLVLIFLAARALMALMALGAFFLNCTPWHSL